MNQILQITNDARQRQTLFIEDGTSFSLEIYFIPMQLGWFITELIYKDVTIRNIRITNSPNMLHQFRNQLPFGIACFSKDDREPSLVNDFVSQASKLYILTTADVAAYTRFLTGE